MEKPNGKRECDMSCLAQLKQNYSDYYLKYDLPSFEDLNREFSIERASDVESDFPLREIKKVVADKLQNYLRFIEALLSPTEASIFVFSIVRSISVEDKKRLTEVYKKLAKINLELIELDVDYDEKLEAEFVKKCFNEWNSIKPELKKFFKDMNGSWGNKIEFTNENYFG